MKPNDREAILYAFALEPNYDRQTIERYVRQYPDLAEDLIDILSERRLREATGPQAAEVIADPDWEQAWLEFRQCEPQKASSERTVNPFLAFRGQPFARLAEALNLPRSILAALRDGLVKAQSIPDRLVARMAQAMGSSVDSLRGYFANPQLSLSARAFKSDDKPSHQGQVTFEELVRSTSMSEEQRQHLLEDCKRDGLDGGQSSEG